MKAPAIGAKFSSLNTARIIREASHFFKHKFRGYEAKKLAFEVPEHLTRAVDLAHRTTDMDVCYFLPSFLSSSLSNYK